MKTKEKTFGDLKVGDEFYVVNIEYGFITKRKVLDTLEEVNDSVQLEVVDTDSYDYEYDSRVISFPKDFSLYGTYATTVETAKEFVKFWEGTEKKKKIKEKVNKMMDLLNNCEL